MSWPYPGSEPCKSEGCEQPAVDGDDRCERCVAIREWDGQSWDADGLEEEESRVREMERFERRLDRADIAKKEDRGE